MIEQLATNIRSTITVSDKELDTILQYFKPMKYRKNELLTNAGQQYHQKMFFVVSGCLRIYFINESGTDSTRHLIFEGAYATALASFITGEPSFEYVQALEDTEVYYVTQEDFFELLKLVPAWGIFYRKYLEYAYVNNTKRLKEMVTLDATERYRKLLAINPQVVRRLPNKIVATYINVSQETLSRLKSKV